jgi:hypothetical protein
MSDSELKPDTLPQRLCGEIQLFDLCELDSCKHKSGRFCTDPDLLGRFEKIAERELRVSQQYASDDSDDGDDSTGDYEDDEMTMDDSFEDEEGDNLHD